MAIRWITPQLIDPVCDNNFNDIDLSAYIPPTATGILYHKIIASTALYIRKNGSTDVHNNSDHFWGGIGVDANRVIEVRGLVGQLAQFYIVAYTESETVWFTNAVLKAALGGAGAYYDIDVSGDVGADIPLGVFVRLSGIMTRTNAIRCNGSTDERYVAGNSIYFVGVDGSNLFEAKVSNVDCRINVLGYVKNSANLVVNVNGSNYSLGSTGNYADLSALPVNATGGFFEFWNGATLNYNHAYRIKGSSEDIYLNPTYKANAYVQCDANRLIEGKISNLAADTYLMAYTTTPSSANPGFKSLKGVGK